MLHGWRFLLVFLSMMGLGAPFPEPALGQNSKPAALAAVPAATPGEGNSVPLLSQPLRLANFGAVGETMEPAPELAARLTHLRGFVQSSPEDGKPATEGTDVWLGRTAGALYFVLVCRDHHPESIRRHLARRENILKDDTVSVLLDPFEDHRRGVLFTVNPSGIQADAARTENNNPDYSFDQVWDSEARVTRTGWIALISVPYRSLRFRPGPGGWGVVFQRSMPRLSETDWWPRIAATVSGVLRALTFRFIAHRSSTGCGGEREVCVAPSALGSLVALESRPSA